MSNRFRIAFVVYDSGIGGAEVNLFHLFSGMDRKRFHPIVFVPGCGPLTERLDKMGINYLLVPRGKHFSTSIFIFGKKVFNPFAAFFDLLAFVPLIYRLVWQLRVNKINVIHTGAMVAHIYGGIAAKFAKIPCVWHVQDIIDPSLAFGFVRKIFVVLGGCIPVRIVAVSRSVASMFVGKSSAKVELIYNGTNTEEFSPNVDGREVRRALGIGPNDLVVGMVGRLVSWKGQREFLLAAAILIRHFPTIKFLLVGNATFGPSSYCDDLMELCRRLGLKSHVVFAGFRKDVARVIRAMDVLVHASILPEPFGLVVIEGMACGVPVVAADSGGPLEIINNGVDGFLVNPKHTDALANQIRVLLTDHELCKHVALNGRKKVMENFSVDKYINSFEKLFSSCDIQFSA